VINEINEKIWSIKQDVEYRGKLEERMRKLDNEITYKRQLQEHFLKELMKEENDVDKFEKLTFSNIIHSIIGDKQELLKKEKGEYYKAKVKYDEIRSIIEHLERDREVYYNKIKNFGELEKELEELLKEKEKIIESSEMHISYELDKINDELVITKGYLKECNEAVKAGEAACSVLLKVEEPLNSAKNYGTWDMLGGGLLVTSAKHSKIDEARDRMIEARTKLDRFKTELSDVNMNFNVEINIDSFSKFADYFLDGLFSDMNVQSKIDDSLRGIQEAKYKVRNIITGLRRNIESQEKNINKLEESRRELIANA